MMGLQQAAGRVALVGALLFSATAFADKIGAVAVVSGNATRKGSDAKEEVLAKGTEIHLLDVLRVGPGARVKLALNDGSVLMLDENSQLSIDEASFSDMAERSFSATLSFGKAWAKVKKFVAGSDQKFEVHTDKAVAGVRGTIFRIDTVSAMSGTTATVPRVTRVWVKEGVVRVTPSEKLDAKGCPKPKPPKGERKQVPGPTEISAQQWEQLFTDLQVGMSVSVGEEIFCQKQKEPKDEFSKFIDKNQ